jgi:hypothetical protein
VSSTSTDPTTTTARSGALIWALRVVGAALLAGMAWIHLDLWFGITQGGFIGPAFLLNVIAGFGLAVLLLVTPRRFLPWVAALGALVLLGTMGALILASTVGLFGFHESTAAPHYWLSIVVESVGAVVLATLAALTAPRRQRTPRL